TTVVLGALGVYTQAGRAIFDINKKVYRLRELSREPLPMNQLRFANEREESATRFLTQNGVKITEVNDNNGDITLQGNVNDRNNVYNPSLTIDKDERIVQANCTCNWHQQNKLYKGPCEHILALRMQHSRQMA
ncbi:MAG TPA: SWIM zinc finger family protein, partial [Allocoleopsis sp.]